MTVVYGLGVLMEFPTTCRPSMVRDVSIRDGTSNVSKLGCSPTGNKVSAMSVIPDRLARIERDSRSIGAHCKGF